MIDYNLHLHSRFSDGETEPQEYVISAIENGIRTIGFSEHSPLSFDNPFSLKLEDVDEYIASIDALKNEYSNIINIFRALEMDYIPGMSHDFDYWRERTKADYLIGSVHLVAPENSFDLWFTDGPRYETYDDGLNKLFEGDIRTGVKAYFHQMNEMIMTQRFEIVGHVDKIKMHNRDRYFNEDEKWYQDLIDECLDLIKENNLIVEINTRGKYKNRYPGFFPDGLALQKVKSRKIPIIISSDAHNPNEINLGFNEALLTLKGIGFTELVKFEAGNWTTIAI